MYRLAYNLSMWELIPALVVLFLIWCFARRRIKPKKMQLWIWIQSGFLFACVILFLSVPLFGRVNISEQQWPQLFWSYRLAFFEGSYDHFQEIYLNILSFVFISFFASELFPTKRGKIATFFSCTLLSIAIECVQYVFSLGLAETDDIVSNMMGSILGIITSIYGCQCYDAIVQVVKKWKKRKH